jgi:glucose/arabinose dehydrogenase
MTHRSSIRVVAAVAALAAVALGPADVGAVQPRTTAPPPRATLELVAEAESAVDIAWRPDDPAPYVVQQGGTVVQVRPDGTQHVVLDVSDVVTAGGEQGLLGLTFTAGGDVAYVDFTDTDGNTNVAALTVLDDGTLQRDSLRTLIVIDQPYRNHNGGDVAIGPDGMLYIGMGDGGSGGDPERRALDLTSLLGKLLRIDPEPSADLGYTIPPDNPYVASDVDGARGEIWSIGLRNPWRYSFDTLTGDLWIADVGQSATEEIDVAAATDGVGAGKGVDFGWSAYEGDDVFNSDQSAPDHHPPVHTYSHGDRCSISGGVRARGAGAGSLDGWYVFADYCSGEVLALPVSGEGEAITVGDETPLATGTAVTAVRGAPDGTIWVLDGSGVNRLAPS